HQKVLRRADWVTACSQFTLSQVPHIQRSRASVIYNALPPTMESCSADEASTNRYILCAARLTHNKGIDLAIQAFAKAHRQMTGVELWIAGDGKERME